MPYSDRLNPLIELVVPYSWDETTDVRLKHLREEMTRRVVDNSRERLAYIVNKLFGYTSDNPFDDCHHTTAYMIDIGSNRRVLVTTDDQKDNFLVVLTITPRDGDLNAEDITGITVYRHYPVFDASSCCDEDVVVHLLMNAERYSAENDRYSVRPSLGRLLSAVTTNHGLPMIDPVIDYQRIDKSGYFPVTAYSNLSVQSFFWMVMDGLYANLKEKHA